MSLIEEALRRVQDPALQGTQTAPRAPAQPQAPSQRAPARPAKAEPSSELNVGVSAYPWPMTPPTAAPAFGTPSSKTVTAPLLAVAIAILALTAVLAIGGAFWMGRALGGTAPQSAPVVISRPMPPPAPTEHAESVAGRLVLNGIVEGSGKPYAVINGTIVGIGEQYQDFTLLEISNGVARLRRVDGNELLLRISR